MIVFHNIEIVSVCVLFMIQNHLRKKQFCGIFCYIYQLLSFNYIFCMVVINIRNQSISLIDFDRLLLLLNICAMKL